MGHGTWGLGVVVCLALPTAAKAQVAPVGVPGGAVRLEADGSFETWDAHWFDGEKEPLGADVASPALGTDLLPFLASSETVIQQVTGLTGFRLNLGALTTDAEVERGIGMFGISLGITRAITIFGRMPLVQTRVQHHSTLDPTGANAGANPGSAQQQEFFSQFDAALADLDARIAAGDYAGDPTLQALAQNTLASGTSLRDGLFGLLSDPETASPFVPLAGSDAGVAIDGRIADLQATLGTDLGVAGFTAVPALPTDPLTGAELETAIADPTGPVGMNTDESLVRFRGDAEAGLVRVITWAGSRKARNLVARPGSPAAVCQVDGGRWLTLEGTAEVTADPARVAEGVRRYAERYRQPGEREDRVVIELAVTRVLGRG